MNKKLLSGLALVSVAATGFWACGEGNINGKDWNDDIAMASNDQDLQTLKDNALNECRITPDCYAKYQGYLEGTEVPTSVDNPVPDVNSSNSNGGGNSYTMPTVSSSIKIARSSSSINIIDDPVESSSGAAPITDDSFGTCAPAKNPINKGTAVQWKFTANSKYPDFDALKIAKATYDWSFAADAVDDGSGKGTMSGNITYPNSGPTTASVTVMYDGTPITVACDPLQVNGAEITGCTCEPDVAIPDVENGPVTVTWSVSKCATVGATITGYEWTGATGTGESATAAFSEKDQEITPTVVVSNDDNTKQSFTCSAVKAIDASKPDYEFTDQGNTNAIPFVGNVDATVVFNLPSGWHGAGDAGTCTFACQVDRGGTGDGKITGSIGTVEIDGGDYVTATIDVANTIGGKSLPFVLNVGSNAGASCFVAW